MSTQEKKLLISNEGNRQQLRLSVVKAFENETPGTGKGDLASRYRYYVETLQDGNRVYLQRPANLHYGFDFLVCVEGANYSPEGKRCRNYPSHKDFENDLLEKKAKDPDMYVKLFSLLKKVYECHDVGEQEMESVYFDIGLPVDHIVKTIKWLFIEQDIRYWNYSGRNMTWDIVPKPYG